MRRCPSERSRSVLRVAALAVLTVLGAGLRAQSPLTTIYASNNGGSVGGSVYFDLQVNTGLAITQIDLNQSGAAAGTVAVWSVPTTHVGNELSPNAWTLLGTGTMTTSGAIDQPSVFSFAAPITLTPGNYGIQLAASGFGHRYTNGNGTNQTFANAELTMTCGSAQNVAQSTGPLFTPRVFNGSLHYQAGPGWATHVPYGTGCGEQSRSFYELFPAAAAFDLANLTMLLVDTGSSYLVVPGGSWVPPPASATTLALGNDTEVSVALSSPFPAQSGPVTSLVVCSNGFVSAGTGNGTASAPSAAAWLASTRERWGIWHDFDPSASGGGRVVFHQAGGIAYVTWDGVRDVGNAAANRFQLQFDTGSGIVGYAIGAMSGLGNAYLCGYAAAGASRDLGSMDLSVRVPATFATGGADRAALRLLGGQRPLVGSTATLVIGEIPANASLGFQVFGFTQHVAGLSLAPLGMPGCSGYVSPDASVTLVPTGGSLTFSYALPNDPNLSGLAAYTQTAVLGGGVNPAGILVSNGVAITVGTR